MLSRLRQVGGPPAWPGCVTDLGRSSRGPLPYGHGSAAIYTNGYSFGTVAAIVGGKHPPPVRARDSCLRPRLTGRKPCPTVWGRPRPFVEFKGRSENERHLSHRRLAFSRRCFTRGGRVPSIYSLGAAIRVGTVFAAGDTIPSISRGSSRRSCSRPSFALFRIGRSSSSSSPLLFTPHLFCNTIFQVGAIAVTRRLLSRSDTTGNIRRLKVLIGGRGAPKSNIDSACFVESGRDHDAVAALTAALSAGGDGGVCASWNSPLVPGIVPMRMRSGQRALARFSSPPVRSLCVVPASRATAIRLSFREARTSGEARSDT